MIDFHAHNISEFASIRDALKKLDLAETKVLLVVDDDRHLIGTLTDGDIRRYLLKGCPIENTIESVLNRSPVILRETDLTLGVARILITEHKIDLLPVLDCKNRVVDVLSRSDVCEGASLQKHFVGQIDIPVVIMAGGRGSRMEPFTKILPKPLIPIGDTPIIEIIMDEFAKQGVKQYFVTLNFRGEMIEAYLDHTPKDYKVDYVWEDDFYGTAGCLTLLRNKLPGTFIVSNCDVIVKANYEEVIRLHREQGAQLSILSSIQHRRIPYGVISYKEGGEVVKIEEKPESSFTINSGVYVLERSVLDYIPENQIFHMTDLIQALIQNQKKVITYPVNENEYVDIGQWEDYKKAMDKLRLLS